MSYKIYNDDCLKVMKELANDNVRVDLVLTDPPYGTTACKWDSVISFDSMWDCISNITNDNTPIVLFGSEPFSTMLRASNIKNYKYDFIWDKISVSNPQLAKIQPLKNFENISIFSKNNEKINYYPQGLEKIRKPKNNGKLNSETEKLNHINRREDYIQEYTNYPKAIIKFPRPIDNLHPTQKPIALLEYLIKTYTIERETVLDFTMGSGSTGVACQNTNRDFIGIELDKEYYEIAEKRLEENSKQTKLNIKSKGQTALI